MDYTSTFIEENINNVIKQFRADSDISVSGITSEIQRLIGQKPSVIIKYDKLRMMNEATGLNEVVSENIKSITVAYADGTMTGKFPNIKTLEFYL